MTYGFKFFLPMASISAERIELTPDDYAAVTAKYLAEAGVETLKISYAGAWPLSDFAVQVPHFQVLVPATDLGRLAEYFNRTPEEFELDYSGELVRLSE